MAITPRPRASAAADADAFIDRAAGTVPSAAAGRPTANEAYSPKRVRKGNKVQISVTLDEQLVDELTALAKQVGISRAALMTIACKEAVARGVSVTPQTMT